ncbi:MAG: Oligosaccharide biosynthesis protein Alg14 like protein [Verrucomicrobia bacterium]|nr:Oligosaccharide biosynthesis protein Alg14 like protein [Verrucomicrobiota bacterium]
MSARKPKVIAVSSGGGHWVQLLRLRPAFVDSDVTFVTVNPGNRRDVGDAKFRLIPDSNRWNKLALVRSMLGAFWILLMVRPDVVITTGAAPGYFMVRLAKVFGARTVWLDSVANAETLSMSGEKAGRHVDLWLTQWSHLAKENGPVYRGSVL